MYYEEASKMTVTRGQSKSEIEKHGHTFEEFVKDHGDKDFYKGKTVLDWLGY